MLQLLQYPSWNDLVMHHFCTLICAIFLAIYPQHEFLEGHIKKMYVILKGLYIQTGYLNRIHVCLIGA